MTAVFVGQVTAVDTDIFVFFDFGDTMREIVFDKEGVGVKKEEIFPHRFFGAEIIGRTKTDIGS